MANIPTSFSNENTKVCIEMRAMLKLGGETNPADPADYFGSNNFFDHLLFSHLLIAN